MASLFKTKNMGKIDQALRIITGLVMIYVGLINQEIIDNFSINIIVGIFGIVSILFAVVAFCPIYTLGNINTMKRATEED